MRTFLFLLLLTFSVHSFAGYDPFMRLHINQRTFLNAGTVCPYCKGSSFAAFGGMYANEFLLEDHSAMYFAAGNDADNEVHGPWDFSYTRSNTMNSTTDAYSGRYAYSFPVGSWRAGIGTRVSYYRFKEERELVTGPPYAIVQNIHAKGSQFDFDAGLMLTDLHGTYFGASVRHLAAPVYALKDEKSNLPFYDEERLPRTFCAIAGTMVKLGGPWDVLPDATFQYDGINTSVEGGAMLRFNHCWAAGGSYQSGGPAPAWSIRAGYTRTTFKWIAAFEPSKAGWVAETGMVFRFGFPESSECNGSCSVVPPKKKKRKTRTEFMPHGE